MIKVPYIYGSMEGMSDSEKTALKKFCLQLKDLCLEHTGGALVHHERHDVPFSELTAEQADHIIRHRLGSETSLFVAVAGVYSFDLGVMIEMAYHSDVPVVLIGHHFTFFTGAVPKLVAGNPGVTKRIAYDKQYEGALAAFEDYLLISNT